MGIEPTSEAWEASILPLNYARSSSKWNDSITLRNRLKLFLVTTGHIYCDQSLYRRVRAEGRSLLKASC